MRFFLQFSFANIVFMFLLHYTCRILCSINSRKAFKFLSKRLVLLLYGNQHRHLYFVHKTTYLWSRGIPGVGNCLFLRDRGWGIDRQVRKKLQISWVCPGEMVTGRIEPCIRIYLPWESSPEKASKPSKESTKSIEVFKQEADKSANRGAH